MAIKVGLSDEDVGNCFINVCFLKEMVLFIFFLHSHTSWITIVLLSLTPSAKSEGQIK